MSLSEKIRIGISSCLLGNKVRFDGGHKLDYYIIAMFNQLVEWVPVCPEVEYGLPVPRETMRLVGNPESPRLVTTLTGIDHTDGIIQWSKRKIKELETREIRGFVFKSKSPSCGIRDIEVFSQEGRQDSRGIGFFARAIMIAFSFLPVEDETGLRDPEIKKEFFKKIWLTTECRKLPCLNVHERNQ